MNQLLDSTDMGISARPRRVKRAHPADDLSFMARKKPHGTGIDYWIVEDMGDYQANWDKGYELADEYLSYVGRYPTNGNVTLLNSIVTAMMERCRERGRLSGIELAFLSRVNSYAVSCAVAVEKGVMK